VAPHHEGTKDTKLLRDTAGTGHGTTNKLLFLLSFFVPFVPFVSFVPSSCSLASDADRSGANDADPTSWQP
jgi:hypothetical protein